MDAPRFRILRFFIGLWATGIAVSILAAASRLDDLPYLGMSERGVVVGMVVPGGPADRAGLRAGDRLVSLDGDPVGERIGQGPSLRQAAPGKRIDLRVRRGGDEIPIRLVPDRLPQGERIWNVAQAITALISLFVGSAVLVKRSRDLTFVFFLICLALSQFLYRPYVPDLPAMRAAAELGTMLLTSFFPFLFLHFFLLFPYQRSILRERPIWIRLLYLPAAALFLLFVLLAYGIFPPGAAAPLARAGELVLSIAFTASFAISAGLFLRAYRRTTLPSIQRKLRVALGGTIAAVLPIAAVVLYYALFPHRPIPVDRYAAILLVLLPISFGYAIIRHGVFDIEFLVKRSLTFTGILGVLVLLYFISFLLLQEIFHDLPGLSATLASGLALVLVLALFSPLRSHLQDLVERSLYPERFESRRRLREFARSLPLLPEEGQIIRATLANLARIHGIERGAYFPESDPEGAAEIAWGFLDGERRALNLGSVLRDPVYGRGEPLLREEVEAEVPHGKLGTMEAAALERLSPTIFLPIATRRHRFGIAAIGPRLDGEPFGDGDIETLDLLGSQTALAMENALFQREHQIREAMMRELEIAQGLQRRLLPQAAPAMPGIAIAAGTLPCENVGGDYYDYGLAEDASLYFAVADVSGKGIPAAILMANVQALFRAEASTRRGPDQILERMNRRLCEIERPDRFVSFFCGVVDSDGHSIRYSNAGHPPPLLIRADGRTVLLDAAALLLGIDPQTRYPIDSVPLGAGDLVLSYTDGILDPGARGATLREDELRRLALGLRGRPVEEILERILARIRQALTLADDTTLLLLKTLATGTPPAFLGNLP